MVMLVGIVHYRKGIEMEQFEKWKDGKCVKVCNLCYIGVCGDCSGIGTKEDTWRAAFENIQQWIMGRRCTGEDVLDYINKEIL